MRPVWKSKELPEVIIKISLWVCAHSFPGTLDDNGKPPPTPPPLGQPRLAVIKMVSFMECFSFPLLKASMRKRQIALQRGETPVTPKASSEPQLLNLSSLDLAHVQKDQMCLRLGMCPSPK